MDGLNEELQQVLEDASYRITLTNQREHLKVKVAKDLTYAYSGGLFKVTPELINFVRLWIDLGNKIIILSDSNNNPIRIDNQEDFLDELVSRYTSAMNDYHAAYERLKLARNAKKVVEAA